MTRESGKILWGAGLLLVYWISIYNGVGEAKGVVSWALLALYTGCLPFVFEHRGALAALETALQPLLRRSP